MNDTVRNASGCENPVTSSRRGMLAVLAAAAAVPAIASAPSMTAPSRAAWDRAKAAYQGRLLAQEAVEKFGKLYELTEERKLTRSTINFHVGAKAYVSVETHPHLAKEIGLHNAACEAEDAACNDWLREYVDPTDRAAVTVLLTPAPDLDAVQFKFATIARHELHTWTTTPRDCAEVIHEDLHRLGLLG